MNLLGPGSVGRRGDGEAQGEDRAAVIGVGGGDRAAVLFGDLAHDRQPEAAALAAARVRAAEETIKHVGEIIGNDPGAVVANLDAFGVRPGSSTVPPGGE